MGKNIELGPRAKTVLENCKNCEYVKRKQSDNDVCRFGVDALKIVGEGDSFSSVFSNQDIETSIGYVASIRDKNPNCPNLLKK